MATLETAIRIVESTRLRPEPQGGPTDPASPSVPAGSTVKNPADEPAKTEVAGG